MRRIPSVAIGILVLGALTIGHACAQVGGLVFQGLGIVPGTEFSRGMAVSADGSVVVGTSPLSGQFGQGFVWTQSTGIVGLGGLPGGNGRSEAYAVSADGTTIVGRGFFSGRSYEAFRWTQATGMVGLGAAFVPIPTAVSADGSVIAGGGFRWTQAGGVEQLTNTGPPGTNFGVIALSTDGSVMVGGGNVLGAPRGFIYAPGFGLTSIGTLGGALNASYAYAVSPDGTTVVGASFSTVPGSGGADTLEAALWTRSGGLRGLGNLPGNPGGFFGSQANGVSADGRVVVGTAQNSSPNTAFLWRDDIGMVNLYDYLNALGLGSALSGWRLGAANAISADGTTIVGTGVNPQGVSEAFRVYNPRGFGLATTAAAPEPGTLVFGLLSLAGSAVARRHARKRTVGRRQ